MIIDYIYDKTAESGEIKTIYETYESSTIRRSVCKCFCPWRSEQTVSHCQFFDSKGKNIAELILPNVDAYRIYARERGIVLADNGKKVVIPGFKKNETACYSLEKGTLLWTSEIEKVMDIYPFQDKIYCDWSTSKGGLTLISSITGAVLSKIFSYKFKLQPPSIKRLNAQFLVIYILGSVFLYDMERDEFLLTKKHFQEPSEFYTLKKVYTGNNVGEVIFEFTDFVTTNDEHGIIAKAEWQKSEVIVKISDLLDGASPSPFGNKIPNDKKSLDRV
jgi:hypothetical protein